MTDDKPDQPEHCAKTDIYAPFQKELAELINKHSLENGLEMPDFVMAQLLVNILKAMRVAKAQNDSWYGKQAYSDDCKDVTCACFQEIK